MKNTAKKGKTTSEKILEIRNKTKNSLKKLRENRQWSQSDLAKVIKDIDKDFIIDNGTGKQTISQLERGARTLTIDKGYIYADIFGVSLDYIYGREKDWIPEHKEMKEHLGLSDETLNHIEYMNKEYKEIIYILDTIINPNNNLPFVEFLLAIKEYLLTDNKKDEIIQLFNISKLAEKMAEELKKNY